MTKIELLERLDNLTPKLQDLGNRLYSKWGTDSYVERCNLFDVREEIIKIIEQIKLAQLKAEKEKPTTNKTKQNDIDDLNQYIINLLFSAYSDGKQGVTLDVFDRWLEEQMDHIDDYLKSQLPSIEAEKEVTDENIENAFPTNIYKLAESLHIPKDLMSAEMSEALKGIQEGNENKQIGAKAHRDNLIKK